MISCDDELMVIGNDSRSGCRSNRAVAEDANGDEPVRVRGVQQGVPEGAESAAAPAGAQPAVEAAAEEQQGGAEEGVPVPGAELRPPRPRPGPRRPHRNQEALLQKARREEVQVREMLQEIRRPF